MKPFILALIWSCSRWLPSAAAVSVTVTNCSELATYQSTATSLTVQMPDQPCCFFGTSTWPALTSLRLTCVQTTATLSTASMPSMASLTTKSSIGSSYEMSFFSHLGSLTTLMLNGPNTIGSRAFAALTALQSLIIVNYADQDDAAIAQHRLSLWRDTFEGLSQLSSLTVSEMGLQSPPETLFDPLVQLTYLDLSFNQLTRLPSSLLACTTLHHLNLNVNQLTSLSAALSFPKLQKLALDNNRIVYLQSGVFQHLTLLKELSLSANSLVQLDTAIFSPLTALTELLLTYNHLDALPEGIFRSLTLLKLLDLSNNQLTSLPGLHACSRLGTLVLSSNPIPSLDPDVFEALSALTQLNLDGTALTQLPGQLLRNTANLTLLNLDLASHLQELPPQLLSRLGKLQGLSADSCAISTIDPQQFEGVPNLQTLSLKGNVLTFFPSQAIDGLPLLVLDVSNNAITTLPERLVLPLLQELYLSSNPLSIIPKTFLDVVPFLIHLEIGSNQLTELDAGLLAGVPLLQELHLEHTKLSLFPTGFFASSSMLQALNFADSQLTQVSANVFGSVLPNLHWIDISYNSLTSLDPGLLPLFPALNVLNLANNALKYLPPNPFAVHRNLSSIDLSHNRLTKLPVGWLDGPRMALAHLLLTDNCLTQLNVTQPLPSLTELHIAGASTQDAAVSIDLLLLPKLALLNAVGVPFSEDVLKAALSQTILIVLKFGSPLLCSDRASRELSLVLASNSTLTDLELAQSVCQRILLTYPPETLIISNHSQLTSITVSANYIKLFNISLNPRLTSISHVPTDIVDISFTSIPYSQQFVSTTGQFGLYARSMLAPSTYAIRLSQLISDCYLKAVVCDLSDNDFLNHVPALNAGYSNRIVLQRGAEAMNPSLFQFNDIIFRASMSLISLGKAPVQCGLQSGAFKPDNSLFYQLQSSLATSSVECSCSPGYSQQVDGSCFLHKSSLWELFRKSRAAVAILSLLIIALVAGPAVVLIRRRLARLSHDVELHQYLLADAEEDVLALQKGWQIGGEEVKLLGRIDSDSPGAFGEVWKADWEGLTVCVKVLKEQMSMHDSLADFDAEISFLQRTRSPYLVRFFGAGQLPDSTTPFLVLELMELGSLDTFLTRRAVSEVSWECRVSIVQDVARGMDYIHNTLHKLHRDLKSGNVLCTGSSVAPRVKIGDFGSIKGQFGNSTEHRRNTMEQPETGAVSNKMTRGIGTPIYMAIEVIRGDEYDDKAEVWSYGVMLYEIATHRIPDLLTELPAEVVGKTRGPYLAHVLKLLEAGHRLELSAFELVEQGAPEWYTTLMARCMLASPRLRPGFADIVEEELEYHSRGSSPV